jgi:hypothetical protein
MTAVAQLFQGFILKTVNGTGGMPDMTGHTDILFLRPEHIKPNSMLLGKLRHRI